MTSHTHRRIPTLAVAAALGAALSGCARSPAPAAAPDPPGVRNPLSRRTAR